ncbi:MAG: hydroxyacylglutathione hydrolase [Pelotomaculum sp. PtaB.Bin104]|nr:MAG: hydroxyacylglutathione hydrolase [Pelotomaculum sp. PtaB.Bin104]
MVENILENIFKIEIPLPNNPLQALNSYIIKGKDRTLVIDTGMNREECKTAMLDGLAEIGVSLKKIDFFITHMHTDHCGLVASLVKSFPMIYCSRPAATGIAALCRPEYWDKAKAIGHLIGFPEQELQYAIDNHPGNKYCPRGKMSFNILKDQDTLSVGGYNFTCIETPGHTKGHLCLYEPKAKLLFSGDHILADITPNISLGLTYENDLLLAYINNLDKISLLDTSLVLPGHRSLITNCKARIRELKKHHKLRSDEVLSILKNGSQNAYQVASQMTWDMTFETWEQFPVLQKWFACGEAMAHLKYLEEKQLIYKDEKEKAYYYSLSERSKDIASCCWAVTLTQAKFF